MGQQPIPGKKSGRQMTLSFSVADDVLPGAGRRLHDHEVPLQLPHLPHHRQHLPAGKAVTMQRLLESCWQCQFGDE